MAAATSPARHAASLATSASIREPRQSKVHRAMEWPKPSSVRSSVIMSASVRARMQTPSCTSYQLGLITTTRFTRTRHSDIVHPVSSSQLAEARDRVRSVGGLQHGIALDQVRVAASIGQRGTAGPSRSVHRPDRWGAIVVLPKNVGLAVAVEVGGVFDMPRRSGIGQRGTAGPSRSVHRPDRWGAIVVLPKKIGLAVGVEIVAHERMRTTSYDLEQLTHQLVGCRGC